MKNAKKYFSLLFFFKLVIFSPLLAGETLDYTHEHLLESAMNARYHSLPDVEFSPSTEFLRMKLGYAQFSGGPSDSKTLMTGLQKTIVRDSSWSTIVFGFYDFSFIKTNSENSMAMIIKNQEAIESFNTQILLQAHNAFSHHLGGGVGEVYRFNSSYALQAGVCGELYTIKNFKIDFTTLNETTNYNGSFDYDHTYLLYTPYLNFNWFPSSKIFGMHSVARLIMTYPMPRGDLARVVAVGSNQLNLKKNSEHIPDAFVGVGYGLESPGKNWRVDVGATLDFFLFEGSLMHKGITNPLFLNYSFIF